MTKLNIEKHILVMRLAKKWKSRCQQIKILNSSRKYKIIDLAKDAGIHAATVREIINEKCTNPKLSTINKIEAVLEKRGV